MTLNQAQQAAAEEMYGLLLQMARIRLLFALYGAMARGRWSVSPFFYYSSAGHEQQAAEATSLQSIESER